MEIIASLFIIVLGCLGHFIFEWSGHRKWAGLLFAVNESTWEHIKLTIYPSFLWLLAEGLYRGWSQGLVVAQFAAMAATMLLVPALFYGYTAFTHKNWLWSDILVFCVAVVAGRWIFLLVFNALGASLPVVWFVLALVGMALVLEMYLRLSYHPWHNFLFRDPQNGDFGPRGHSCHSHFHQHPHNH